MNCILKIIQLDDILLAGQEHFLKIRRKQEVDEKMKSKFKKLLATALVLCLVLALLPAAAFAEGTYTVTFADANGNPKDSYTFGTVTAVLDPRNDDTLLLSNSFNEGDQVLITATPNPGCGLVSLVVGEVPVPISDPADGASYSFEITKDTTVKAAFRPFHACLLYTSPSPRDA